MVSSRRKSVFLRRAKLGQSERPDWNIFPFPAELCRYSRTTDGQRPRRIRDHSLRREERVSNVLNKSYCSKISPVREVLGWPKGNCVRLVAYADGRKIFFREKLY